MEFKRVTLEISGSTGIVTMNHPEVMNAVGPEMVEGLVAAIDEAEKAEHGLRCLILTGQGRGFCAGANLQGGPSAGSFTGKARDAGAALETVYHPFLRRLRNLQMPLITAVNGAAAGVGMSFALMGDMVLAGRSAYFLQAFRRIGLVPDGGSTWLLPRLVGLARAKELSLMGEKLSAERALEWGLINRVYGDNELMTEARALAKELSEGPTVSLRLIRKLYWESPVNSYEEQLDLERWSQREAGRSADFVEGVSAFLQKRPAHFKGE